MNLARTDGGTHDSLVRLVHLDSRDGQTMPRVDVQRIPPGNDLLVSAREMDDAHVDRAQLCWGQAFLGDIASTIWIRYDGHVESEMV